MKRLFDIVLALVLFVPISLFVVILSITILVCDRFSPFFLQKRIGKDGLLFTCYKLQTMKPAQEQSVIGEREKDADRSTKFGEFIRNHGWDELPQIINVLSGQMSFIGPRPLLQRTFDRIMEKNPDMIEDIGAWQDARKRVRPGITGWHQIQLLPSASIIRCDMEYLKNYSISKDVKILFVTGLAFVFGKKIASKIVS